MEVYLKKSIPDQVNRAIAPLRYEPPQSGLPFIWSNNADKQARARRWYFANKVPRGSKGGRYKRTHGLAQGWQVIVTGSGENIQIAVVNPAERAVNFVQSVQQVPSHQVSGWQQYEGVLLKAEENAENSIIENWFVILETGGV